MEIVIAIPARMESSRLPGKVLKDILGKPMLLRVIERCRLAKCTNKIVLCTDSDQIANEASCWNVDDIIKTSVECKSGSERIGSVAQALVGDNQLNKSLIINVQGDQPFIDPLIIDKIAQQFIDNQPEIVTPVYPLPPINIHDPNHVKVLVSSSDKAIYFSRSAIPHVRDLHKDRWHEKVTYWGHIGVYGFRGDIIANWNNFPSSILEDSERLEHLRLIESGIPISVFKVDSQSLSVDTPEQLEQAQKLAINF